MALYPVTIYFNNEQVFKKVPTAIGHHFTLTSEVREWLNESTEGMGWGDQEVQEVTTGDYVGVTFTFIEDYQAVLFKLTWGGL